MTNAERFYKYKETLRTNYTPIARLEWLANDGTVLFDISNKTIQGGSLTCTFQDGIRRTGNVTVENWANEFDAHPNKIWFGQKIRLLQGLILPDGSEFYIPQGIFYISNPTIAYNPSERNTTLQLVDKWAFLDGSLSGFLEGIYQLNIGDNLFTAIQQLLLTDHGNGSVIDDVAPLLSSYYIGKTINISGTSYPILDCPYTARIDIGQSLADVLLEINTMLVSTIGYDAYGRLNLLPAQTDILDSTREILWNFSTDQAEFFGMSSTAKMTEVYNEVKIYGGTINGSTANGLAQNTDIRSSTCIQRIGKKTLCKSEPKYYSDAQCQALAEYRLLRSKILNSSVELICAPMYHFKENALITIHRKDIEPEPQIYLINSFTNPISQTGTMNCSVTNVSANL